LINSNEANAGKIVEKALVDGLANYKVSADNIFELMPKQTHQRMLGQFKLSVYSYRWFIKTIKRGLNPKDFMNG
jgi:hypothetical protein